MFDFIAKPFGILLLWLYQIAHNYGLAVIAFALIVKVILLPFQMKSKRGMMQMSSMQPLVKELEKKHGANKQKYNEEVAKLYKEEKINPASGCIWSFIPLPILLALYSAIRQPITIMMGVAKDLIDQKFIETTAKPFFDTLLQIGYKLPEKIGAYDQIKQTNTIHDQFSKFIDLVSGNPELASIAGKFKDIDYNFFGMNLGDQPQWKIWEYNWSDPKTLIPALLLFLIPVLSGASAYLSSFIAQKTNPQQSDASGGGSMKTMMMLMPLMSVYFAFIMPAALGVYWIAQSVFTIIQDVVLTQHYKKIIDVEDEARTLRRAKEREIEAKRLETERKKAENNTELNPNTSKRKLTVQEKKDQQLKAAEWDKKTSGEPEKDDNPSRAGDRRYARGRAYDPNRFDNNKADDDNNDGAEVTDNDEDS